MAGNKEIGAVGEEIAAQTVLGKGMSIIQRNFRCKHGEIDIIALDRETIVFIEVKTRRSTRYGYPEEAVDYRKQKKLRMLASLFLAKYYSPSFACRFDVYSVFLQNGNQPPRVKVLENCF